MNVKRRIFAPALFALLLALAAAVCVCLTAKPARAAAAVSAGLTQAEIAAVHDRHFTDGTHADAIDLSGGQATVDTMELGTDGVETHYYLSCNVTANDVIIIASGAVVNLCLNGYALTFVIPDADTKESFALTIRRSLGYNTTTLRLFDCYDPAVDSGADFTHTVVDPTSDTGATVEIKGGLMTSPDRTYNRGGLIRSSMLISDRIAIEMYGGTIAGCRSLAFYYRGSLKMYGGAVSYNSPANRSASSYNRGGGIFAGHGSTLEIHGGDLSHNRAWSGGAIYLEKLGSPNPGAVMRMTGGTIRANLANGTSGENRGGGAIYAGEESSVEITGGEITGNRATASGGGILALGNVSLADCTITDNVAANADEPALGGGVYAANGCSVSGAVVLRDNRADGDAGTSNLYLPGGMKVAVSGTLTDAEIGIDSADRYGQLTTGYPAGGADDAAYTNDAQPQSYFFLDDPSLFIAAAENGEAAVANLLTASFAKDAVAVDATPDSFKQDLSVTARLVTADGTTDVAIPAQGYSLSLAEGQTALYTGQNTVTVTCGKSAGSANRTTFTVDAPLERITALIDPQAAVAKTTTLEQLKALIAVTMHGKEGGTAAAPDFTLSFTDGKTALTPGDNTVTVSYGGKTFELNVYVAPLVESITAQIDLGDLTVTTATTLEQLKTLIAVTARLDDGSTAAAPDFTLSFTDGKTALGEGENVLLVTYDGKTYRLTINVARVPKGLSGGAIAGIVIGCVAGALILTLLALFLFRRDKSISFLGFYAAMGGSVKNAAVKGGSKIKGLFVRADKNVPAQTTEPFEKDDETENADDKHTDTDDTDR